MSLIPWEGEVMAEDDESSPGKRKPYVPRGRSGPPWLGRGQPHESWLDAVIRQAEAEGHFDNLPGQGKPLPPANPYEALDEWALANHILKQSGFLPDWLQLRKEVEEERPAVVAALDAYRRQREVLDPATPWTPRHCAAWRSATSRWRPRSTGRSTSTTCAGRAPSRSWRASSRTPSPASARGAADGRQRSTS